MATQVNQKISDMDRLEDIFDGPEVMFPVAVEGDTTNYRVNASQLRDEIEVSVSNLAFEQLLVLTPQAIRSVPAEYQSMGGYDDDNLCVLAAHKVGVEGTGEFFKPACDGLMLLRNWPLQTTGGEESCVIHLKLEHLYNDSFVVEYRARMQALHSLQLKTVVLSNESTNVFLPGAHGSVIVGISCSAGVESVMGLPVAGGDARYHLIPPSESGDPRYVKTFIPATSYSLSEIAVTGTGHTTIMFVDYLSAYGSPMLDADGAVELAETFTDPAGVDWTNSWEREESQANGVTLDARWRWLRSWGNGNWGDNALRGRENFSQSSNRYLAMKVCITEVETGSDALALGWAYQEGYSYDALGYGLLFRQDGSICLVESGVVGEAVGQWQVGVTYDVRIKLGSSEASYSIRGGQYGTLGDNNSWVPFGPETQTQLADDSVPLNVLVTNKHSTAFVTNVRSWLHVLT